MGRLANLTDVTITLGGGTLNLTTVTNLSGVSLTVTKGWDNVTGYGTPNGLTFFDAVTK